MAMSNGVAGHLGLDVIADISACSGKRVNIPR
jgi:hypothetical protein